MPALALRQRPTLMALAGLALATVLVILGRLGPNTDLGRQLIEQSVNGTSLGSLGVLRIEGLGGDPWSTPTVRRLTITDAHGIWLDARRLALAWKPSSLWARRVKVVSLNAASVSLDHRPSPGPPGKGGRLPVSIEIDRFATRLSTAPAISQRPGVYDLDGAVDVRRSGAIRVRLAAASRLHAGDHLTARLDVAQDKHFSLAADAVEAQGGAIAGSLGLAADQPFALAARAGGSLAQGRISVDTRIGAARPLVIDGAWNPQGGHAHGDLILRASTLLRGWAGRLGDTAHFDVTGRQASDRLYDFNLNLLADNLNLAAQGQANVGAWTTGPRGLALDARIGDLTRIASWSRTGPARLTGRLTGDKTHWVLVGDAALQKFSDGGFALASLSGPLKLESKGPDLLITATADGAGGSGQGLLAALLGGRPHASAEVTRFADGRLLFRQLQVQGSGLKLNATGGVGILGDLAFKGDAAMTNLAVAHPGARGLVSATWSAGQAGKAPWSFTIDAQGQGFTLGWQEADRLLGTAPHLTGQGRWADNKIEIAQASLAGSAGSTTAIGILDPAGPLALKLAWQAKGPFVVGPVEIDGAAKGTGDLAGTFVDPKVDVVANLASVDAPGLPLQDAHVILSFQHQPSGGDGRIAVNAASQYGPARGASAFRFVEGGVDLAGLDLDAGGVTAKGALALRRGEPSSADLAFSAGPGALLAQGHAQGRLRVTGGGGDTQANLSLDASDAALRDGGIAVKTLQLTAQGPLKHLPYRVTAEGASAGGPWRARGSGVFGDDGASHALSFAGDGRVGRVDFHTLSPAQVRFDARGVTAKAELDAGGGRADLNLANLNGTASVKARLANVNLSLLNEELVGKISADLTLAGRGPRLDGVIAARLAGAAGRDERNAPPVDGEVDARIAGPQMRVDARLHNSAGLKADGDMVLPVTTSAAPFSVALDYHRPVSGRFAIDGELKPLWDLALGGAESLSGKVSARGTLAGTLSDPRALGQVALEDGRFQDADTGLRLENLTLRANLADNAVDVSTFNATDGARGKVVGSGRASLLRDGASSFRADLSGFRLIDNDLAQATASGRVSINRAADGKVQLTGALTIDRALISPNPPVATGVVPMDVVEVHRPDMGDLIAPPTAPREAPIALDVSIRAAGGVFLKGRGLNIETGLDAHVSGTARVPLLTGKARVVRGDYDFAGQRFKLDDRSVIYLGASAQTIRLDLTAVRDNPSLTAVIRITGTAAKPAISLTSTPALPQDEILSQVLFGASASQLSGVEAAQMASALAGLSGGGGFDLIGGLRTFAHLDRLAFGDNAVTGTTVSGGKYIGDRLYVELTGGGREGQGGQIEWRVKKHLSLLAKFGNQGDSQIAIRWRRSY